MVSTVSGVGGGTAQLASTTTLALSASFPLSASRLAVSPLSSSPDERGPCGRRREMAYERRSGS
jgi:hypothetical protein